MQAFMVHYTASKHAITGMARAFAAELGRYRIRVNSLHPGAVATPMGTAGCARHCRPRTTIRICRACTSRCSPKASPSRKTSQMPSPGWRPMSRNSLPQHCFGRSWRRLRLMRGLKGKTFIVAGGATGIGAGTAERLAGEGASCRRRHQHRRRHRHRRADHASGGRAIAVEFDLADAVRARTHRPHHRRVRRDSRASQRRCRPLGEQPGPRHHDAGHRVRRLAAHSGRQPARLRPHHPRGTAAPVGRVRQHRQHLFGRVAGHRPATRRLQRLQGRRQPAHPSRRQQLGRSTSAATASCPAW